MFTVRSNYLLTVNTFTVNSINLLFVEYTVDVYSRNIRFFEYISTGKKILSINSDCWRVARQLWRKSSMLNYRVVNLVNI